MIQIPIDQILFVAAAVVSGVIVIWCGYWFLLAMKYINDPARKILLIPATWATFSLGTLLATNIVTGDADILVATVIGAIFALAGAIHPIAKREPEPEEEDNEEQVQPVQQPNGPLV